MKTSPEPNETSAHLRSSSTPSTTTPSDMPPEATSPPPSTTPPAALPSAQPQEPWDAIQLKTGLVIVKVLTPGQSAGGVIFPERFKSSLPVATILLTGPESKYAPGDTVFVPAWVGTAVAFGQFTASILEESDIWGTVDLKALTAITGEVEEPTPQFPVGEKSAADAIQLEDADATDA